MRVDARIAAHEAGHAAGLLFFGRLPRIIRADNPANDESASGCVEFDCGDGVTRGMATDWFTAILLGPICEPGRTDPWPPPFEALLREHPERDISDLAQLARLARYLRLDRSGYASLVAIAYHLADTALFKEAHAAVAAELCRVPVLDKRRLLTLLGPKMIAKFELEAA
jgi:hypothetical protein